MFSLILGVFYRLLGGIWCLRSQRGYRIYSTGSFSWRTVAGLMIAGGADVIPHLELLRRC